ncbi:hypothetical protein [Microbacterium sp. CIAB417]|uniref:hypothetical protein n=1 Tax=Microbacterium sp. CIAB417 TaxID=2860287 RepID=UPI001FAC7E32|nr:hypothetical protein [Microbacterium sp. CIAB417]
MTIPRPSRGDGFALGLIATGSISIAVAAAVSIVMNAIDRFGAEPVVRMPLHDAPASAYVDVAGIADAEYSSVLLTLDEASQGVRWLLFLEGALPALATIGVCLVAWWLGISLIRARPFHRSMTWAIGAAAILVMLGGMLGQVFGAFGRAVLVDELAASTPEVLDTLWTFLAELDLAPLGWGLALALIAGAFDIGRRMQRETEGLV